MLRRSLRTLSKVGGGSLLPYSTLFFRSDTRIPKKIFKSGFTSLNPKQGITYRKNPSVDDGMGLSKLGAAGDIDPPSAVCLTRRFDVAPLFPFQKMGKRFIYALAMNDSQIFDTREFQIKDTDAYLQEAIKQGIPLDQARAKIGWPLFAHEYATEKVPFTNIVGAVTCIPLKWLQQGMQVQFRCECPEYNPLCNLPLDIKDDAMRRLEQAIRAGIQWSPHPGSGFGGLTL